jgi:hypothetical protein
MSFMTLSNLKAVSPFLAVCLVLTLALALPIPPLMPTTAFADTTAQTLPFAQNWANTNLITVNNDWSGVPGIIAYRGDDLTAATGVDPQTITADGSATPQSVAANQTNLLIRAERRNLKLPIRRWL